MTATTIRPEPITAEERARRLSLARISESVDVTHVMRPFWFALSCAIAAGGGFYFTGVLDPFGDEAILALYQVPVRIMSVVLALAALTLTVMMVAPFIVARIRYRRAAAAIVASTRVVTVDELEAIERRRPRRRLGWRRQR